MREVTRDFPTRRGGAPTARAAAEALSSFFLEHRAQMLLEYGLMQPAGLIQHSPSDAAGKSGAPSPFEQECGLFFAELVQILGVPKSVGQIYGLLYASPQPLSFSDIVERLEISRGSASQGLQLLRGLGAIKPVRPADSPARPAQPSVTPAATDASRREYYEPELGLRRLVGGILRGNIEPVVEKGKARMRRLRELAESTNNAAGKKFQLKRVEQLETWRRQATLIMPVFKTLLVSTRR